MEFRQRIGAFVASLSTGRPGEYRMCTGGQATLYSSCFAVMALHTLGLLADVEEKTIEDWGEYIGRWQDPETGLFAGPELVGPDALASGAHDREHVSMHLTAHALPALHLLGRRPSHPLAFAHRFTSCDELRTWLDARDWANAWLEGNNLLFVGQLLVWLRDHESCSGAQDALKLYFEWLDREQDPRTGLWGTDGHCDAYNAMYGGYHQLLAYYYCGHPVSHSDRIIDTVLRLQHQNGSFTPYGTGGTCEDVDGTDILANLHERTGYRPKAVRHALAKSMSNHLSHQVEGGGFVYRHSKPFTHMGIKASYTPPGEPDMFSTWFRVHALGVACQVMSDHPLSQLPWQFNSTCSMGWHDPSVAHAPCPDPLRDRLPIPWQWVQLAGRKVGRKFSRSA